MRHLFAALAVGLVLPTAAGRAAIRRCQKRYPTAAEKRAADKRD